MSGKAKILVQFDSDQHPSVFDSVVAIDSGVEHLLPYGSMEPIDVRDLVHGAMFTRGQDSLHNTAVFVGGSNVSTAEQILRAVVDSFFGPVRVSVMMDANGANTTASAAVLCMQRHLDVRGKTIAVLAATGSVGNRVVRLLGRQGAIVRVASRRIERAQEICEQLKVVDSTMQLVPFETSSPHDYDAILEDCDGLISSGAANIRLINRAQWINRESLQVVVDLNAVPPSGIEGIEATDDGKQVDGIHTFGAIGAGNLKMKIHRRCIRSLFEANDQVLDIEEIFAIGQQIESDLIA